MENKIIPFSTQTPSLYGGDPAIAAAAETAKARIQSAYIMAIQKPRDPDQARQKILRMCDNPEFAEKVEYSKPIGNTNIKDLSIRFAEAALALWENILSEVQMVYDDDNICRIRISVIDLETNTQFSRDVTLKKTIERRSKKGREDDYISERKNSYGKIVFTLRATDDEMLIKESAMASKFIRTEGLRLLPAGIKQEAKERARATLAGRDKADPDAAKKRILDAFAGLNIWPNDLKKYLGHSVDTLSPSETASLRNIYTAIDAGEASWTDYVQKKENEGKSDKKEQPQGRQEQQQQQQQQPMTSFAETKKSTMEAGKIEETEEINTPSAFAELVKVQANKDYKYIATKDGIAHDNLSAYIEMVAANNENDCETIMEQIIANDSFAGFWSGFMQGAWKEHFEGKLPIMPKKEPEKNPQPESENSNAFDVVDWKSNHLKAKGLEAFWNTNKTYWKNASETSKKTFHDKWSRVFGETKSFPADEDKEAETIIPVSNNENNSNNVLIDYAIKLREYHETEPERLLKACKEIGYDDIVIPMGKAAQKILYEMFQSISSGE